MNKCGDSMSLCAKRKSTKKSEKCVWESVCESVCVYVREFCLMMRSCVDADQRQQGEEKS